ncbi:hypothetical protein J1N35_041707 [Gossypium stocksii]|uniref:RING-type domain-containing protein n=1 Tax=Gossypium stocksii TaxID=47602 RepID=A0A9D3UG11_9ROSI|nr:hypothetical protein J1N35_041707 [Gossypium stocksii]
MRAKGTRGAARSNAKDKSGREWVSGKDCCICLEEFEVEEEAREMPCKHVFHSGCIEKWLLIHGLCPVCRFMMPPETTETGGGEGDGDRRRMEGGEMNGLEFLQLVFAFASLVKQKRV